MADTAYGSAHSLNYLVTEKNIEPHIPVWDKSIRTDGSFSASDFVWDEGLDRYECPNGKITRSIFENVRDTVRKINQGPEFEKSLRERKKVKMAFVLFYRCYTIQQ